jgi:hypothetical protein
MNDHVFGILITDVGIVASDILMGTSVNINDYLRMRNI